MYGVGLVARSVSPTLFRIAEFGHFLWGFFGAITGAFLYPRSRAAPYYGVAATVGFGFVYEMVETSIGDGPLSQNLVDVGFMLLGGLVGLAFVASWRRWGPK